MLSRGHTHGEIAHKLGISIHTVRTYVQRAKMRNNCNTSMELAVKFAVSQSRMSSDA